MEKAQCRGAPGASSAASSSRMARTSSGAQKTAPQRRLSVAERVMCFPGYIHTTRMCCIHTARMCSGVCRRRAATPMVPAPMPLGKETRRALHDRQSSRAASRAHRCRPCPCTPGSRWPPGTCAARAHSPGRARQCSRLMRLHVAASRASAGLRPAAPARRPRAWAHQMCGLASTVRSGAQMLPSLAAAPSAAGAASRGAFLRARARAPRAALVWHCAPDFLGRAAGQPL